jgi:CRISPR-associated protein Cas1
VVAKRYIKQTTPEINEKIKQLQIAERRILDAKSIEEIMGLEGTAAKNYFGILATVIDKDFSFQGRNRRPPKDPFNAMISLGYTIIFYEIYAELENQSINPFIGFTHATQPNHPSLVSDLIEEWRAALVDSTVMSLIQGHEIDINEFVRDEDSGGVVISSKGVRKLVEKLEKKMATRMNYISYLDSPVSFRRGIWWQAKTLAHCIDYGQLKDYSPLHIR